MDKKGKGLRRHLQGSSDPIELLSQHDRFGLGFCPSKKDRLDMMEEKRMRRMSKFQDKSIEERIHIPSISQSFVSARKVTQQDKAPVKVIQETLLGLTICAIDDDMIPLISSLVVRINPGVELTNWSSREIPIQFSEM